MTKPTASEVTQEIIESWKVKHGKISKYTATDGKVIYFRSPDRKDVAAAQAAQQEKEAITSNEVLCKATALGGDLEILSEDKYLYGLGKHLQKIVESVEGEIEEL